MGGVTVSLVLSLALDHGFHLFFLLPESFFSFVISLVRGLFT